MYGCGFRKSLLPALLLLFPTLLWASGSLTVRVPKNASISYICYKYYARYDPNMLSHLAPLNPSVTDWQQLPQGKEIRLPTPDAMDDLVPEAEEQRVAVTYIDPPVFVIKGGKGRPEPATLNMLLSMDDRIRVGRSGRAEIMASGPRLVRLSESSTLDVGSLAADPEQKSVGARFKLLLGRVWGKVLSLRHRRGRNLYVGTPTAVVGVRGTAYDMNVLDDQSTSVRVFEGEVEIYNPLQKIGDRDAVSGVTQPYKVQGPHKVEGPHRVSLEAWTQIVLKQYQEVRITPEGIGKPQGFDYEQEKDTDWVKWNEERDRDLFSP